MAWADDGERSFAKLGQRLEIAGKRTGVGPDEHAALPQNRISGHRHVPGHKRQMVGRVPRDRVRSRSESFFSRPAQATNRASQRPLAEAGGVVGIPESGMLGQAGIGELFELEAQRGELRGGDAGGLARAWLGGKRAAGQTPAQPALDAAETDLKGAHRVGT